MAEWSVDSEIERLEKYISSLGRNLDLMEKRAVAAERVYMDLIMAVERKFPGESRHETAKRYIVSAETRGDMSGSAAAAQPEEESQ